jgi:uncharacterized phiE125 gp8 family phage protein
VDDVKDFLRLQGTTSEDYLLLAFIKSAESYAENYMKRSINKQQFELRIDGFDGHDGDIELPRPPLTTVSSEVVVTYVEDTTVGNTTTISATAITIDYQSEPGVLYPSYDNEWPEPRDENNAVRITYYSGYATPALVPDSIKQWVKLRVGAMYEHRESLMVGTGNFVTELPHSYVDGLLDEFVVQSV